MDKIELKATFGRFVDSLTPEQLLDFIEIREFYTNWIDKLEKETEET